MLTRLRHFLMLCNIFVLLSCGHSDELNIVGNLEWDRIELTAESSEPITEILIHEGATVIKDQVILQLDKSRAQAQLDEAVAASAQASARLAELKRGARAERIAEARAKLNGAKSEVVAAQNELQRQQSLVEKKLASPESLDNAKMLRDRAISNRDAMRATLEELLKGTTSEELDQAEAALDQAQAHVRNIKITLERLTIRAPDDGVIDTLPFEKGERPKTGSVVAVMLVGKSPYARIYIPEPVRTNIIVNTKASIYVDGITQPFNGHVRMVSKDPVFTPYYSLTMRDRSRLSYLAEITIEDTRGQALPSGVPLFVEFHDQQSTAE